MVSKRLERTQYKKAPAKSVNPRFNDIRNKPKEEVEDEFEVKETETTDTEENI